jgi:hypothetical protein
MIKRVAFRANVFLYFTITVPAILLQVRALAASSPVIEIPCRNQASTQSEHAASVLTACSGTESAVQKVLYGETPSQKNGGVFQNLVNHTRHLYLGKPTYTKNSATGKLTSNNDPKGKIPICSLKRGEIQKEMIKQESGSLPSEVPNQIPEDDSNHLGQRCGDNYEIKITGGISCSWDDGCGFEATGKLVSDLTSPLNAPSGTDLRGSWEITHLRSVYLLAIEEAWLEVTKELTDNNGRLVPQTAAGLVGAVDQQNVLARLRALATNASAESENMVSETNSNQAKTVDDQDLFEKQMSHCLQTEVTFETQADGTVKKTIAANKLKLGETTDATTGIKAIETGSLRQRSEHLCVAWKANQLAVNELIFAEIILRAGKKARDSELANLGFSFVTNVLIPLKNACEESVKNKVDSKLWAIVFTDETAVNVATKKANECLKPKIRENLKNQVKTAFPLLHTTSVWWPESRFNPGVLS